MSDGKNKQKKHGKNMHTRVTGNKRIEMDIGWMDEWNGRMGCRAARLI